MVGLSNRVGSVEKYRLSSVSAVSAGGGDPDRVANGILNDLGFILDGSDRGLNADALYQHAVPCDSAKGLWEFHVQNEGDRGRRGRIVFTKGSVEQVMDSGRIIDSARPNPSSKMEVFNLEGRLLEWSVSCLPKPDPIPDSGNGNGNVSTPPLFPNGGEGSRISGVPEAKCVNRGGGIFEIVPPKVTTLNGHSPKRIAEVSQEVSPNDSTKPRINVGGGELLISINKIRPFKDQPRKFFSNRFIKWLGKSMKQEGQLDPILVVKLENDPDYDWELVDGECRLKAAKNEKILQLRAEVITRDEIPTVLAQHRTSFAKNFCKQGHPSLELALALMEQYKGGVSVEELSTICSKSVPWIYSLLSVNKLVPELLDLLSPHLPKDKRISLELAKILASLPKERQMEVYKETLKEHGIRLQIIKAKSLVQQIMPNRKKSGRANKPSDYSKRLDCIVSRLAADSSLLGSFPDSGIKNLVAYKKPVAEINLDQVLASIERLKSLACKLADAIKADTCGVVKVKSGKHPVRT